MKEQTLKVYDPPILTVELQFTCNALLDAERIPQAMHNEPIAIYEVDDELLRLLKKRKPMFKFDDIPDSVEG